MMSVFFESILLHLDGQAYASVACRTVWCLFSSLLFSLPLFLDFSSPYLLYSADLPSYIREKDSKAWSSFGTSPCKWTTRPTIGSHLRTFVASGFFSVIIPFGLLHWAGFFWFSRSFFSFPFFYSNSSSTIQMISLLSFLSNVVSSHPYTLLFLSHSFCQCDHIVEHDVRPLLFE